MKRKTAPRKRTRDLEASRREILDAAFFEVFTRGFQGVSVDDIVAKTKLTKGAFYHHFPTKLDLGYALVEDVITPMILDRWITPLETFDNPLEGVLQRMKTLIGEADSKQLAWGCPLNNLVQEMSPVDAGFHTRLEKTLNLWIAEMDRHLQRARRNGYLRRDVETAQAAHFIVMSHEGFYGLLKGLRTHRAFDALYGSLKIYFNAIETKPERRRNA